MKHVLEQHEPTWGEAISIWRWIARRSALASLIGGLVVGFLFGILAGAIGLHADLISNLGSIIGGLIGLCVTVYFFKAVIGKRFGNYRLILAPLDNE